MKTQYTMVYEALRDRIKAGEFKPGDKLPSISELQDEYEIGSLGTIRAAQQMLVEDGMVRREQGRGVFVTSSESAREVDVDGMLVSTIEQLQRVRSALVAQRTRRVVINLDDSAHDDAYYVLTSALSEFATTARHEAAEGASVSPAKDEGYAATADWIIELIERSLSGTPRPEAANQ